MNLDKLKDELNAFLKTTRFELYGVEFIKDKKDSILRIYIDNLEGINMEDVVEATHLINPFIDKLDPIEGEYLLEVSSPGAEKELRSIEAVKKAINRYVYLETYEQKLEGKLVDFNGEVLTLIAGKNKRVAINYIDVNLIRLAIKF
ncbi:MAG: ribosome maturation factor RimP [Candidatus Izemoplasmatales bacterium]|jgi:ribosome maturation factor RimP|nr:ribosome maturation factor RimP [Candidatus Izemoplasmatales bacterium]